MRIHSMQEKLSAEMDQWQSTTLHTGEMNTEEDSKWLAFNEGLMSHISAVGCTSLPPMLADPSQHLHYFRVVGALLTHPS